MTSLLLMELDNLREKMSESPGYRRRFGRVTDQGCKINDNGWGEGTQGGCGTTDENRIRGKLLLPNTTIQG